MFKISFDGDVLFAESGEALSDVLMRYGKAVGHPCGGKGRCGKCKVNVNGKEELSCRYKVTSDISVCSINEADVCSDCGLPQTENVHGECCLALDIGTTTLALALVSLDEKKAVKVITENNPQRTYGADVISRLDYCRENSSEILQRVLIDKVNQMIGSFDLCKAYKLYICGNTAMLHFFFGADCSAMGTAPYTPAFLEGRCESAASLGLNNVTQVESLPCIAAFAGADVAAGMNAVGLPQEGKYSLLVDLGTNAEIVLINKNGSVSTSAAAGPCFEGAGISCGMSASDGAVYAFPHGKAKTVNGTKAVGICGSGLIDVVAYMLDIGAVDSTGYMENGQFEIADGVFITQEDVRNFQLAKSAVYSAIMTLVKYNSITHNDIEKVYISGGFSSHINIDSAVRTGLLPSEFADRCVPLKNSALQGTVKYACEKNGILQTVQKTKYIDLSADVFFSDMFIENMTF